MHELSVAQDILQIAIRKARAEGATRIEGIRVAVGVLTTYVDDSLRFYWDSITEGTIAEGSTIEFVRIEGRVKCLSCRHEYATQTAEFRCPCCGGLWTQSLAGNECFVDSIEVYEEEAVCL
jgi:hydrogenase nickel incorporation protein HypA/HybF